MGDSQADTPEANAARNVVCSDLRGGDWGMLTGSGRIGLER